MTDLTTLFSSIAAAIRNKTGSIDKIKASDFPSAIDAIDNTATFNFDGNATTADILKGRTAYTNGPEKVTGTMEDWKNRECPVDQDNTLYDSNRGRLSVAPAGAYSRVAIDQGTTFYILDSFLKQLLNISADKIVKGNTIAGVVGTAQILKGYIEDNDNNNSTISLDPTKSYIIVIGSLWAASEPGLRILWLKPFAAQTTHSPTVLIDNLTSKITYEYDSTAGKTLKSTGDDSYYYVFPFVESTTD